MNDQPSAPEELRVELRNPALAALLAWLIPGLGHLYQGRNGKGGLFMVCILSTWFFGLALGGGHSVYASSRGMGRKLQFACQAGVGLPAMPAVLQGMRVNSGKAPLWDGFMAPPKDDPDELSEWNLKFGSAFDIGVLYTMIAGLLNILAVYDAYGGPMVLPPEDQKKKKKPKGRPPSDEEEKSAPPS